MGDRPPEPAPPAGEPTAARPSGGRGAPPAAGSVGLRRLGTTDTLFHLLDTNGDGFIDQKEATDYARKAKGRNLP